MRIDKEKTKLIKYFNKNKLSLNKIINSLFNNKVRKITYLGNDWLKKMPEYNFGLLKFNVVIENYCNYTVFIKVVDKLKIQECLFCYWCFCEEKYCINKNKFEKRASIANYRTKSYSKKYELQLFSKNKKVWKKSMVEFIDLNKYSKQELKCNINRLLDKYLFIGII